jgi:hypothetical protein
MKTGAPTKAELQRLSVYRQPGSTRANLETQLVYSCLQYLEAVVGCIAERRNVGAMECLKFGQKRAMVTFGRPGQADVYGVLPGGLHFELECKLPGKGARSQPTSEQANWLRRCAKQGAVSLCVTSLEQLSADLEVIFKTRGLRWKREWSL